MDARKMIRAGSLFSGIGGIDLGFEAHEIETVWQVEIDSHCRKLLAARFPNARRYAEVRAVAPTLRAMPHDGSHANGGGQVAIAYRTAGNCGPFEQGDKTACLNTSTDPNQTILLARSSVRRLTPRECERLQGFPDDWTEGFSDSTRYKMLGNAVAVVCARWLGERIKAAHVLRKP